MERLNTPSHLFFLVGLLVAGLEEFITQGVLKNDLSGWIVPTVIAFAPFLVVVYAIELVLRPRLSEAGVVLAYYLIAGAIGLLFEWFVMGLSPWRNPSLLQLPFQVGMFSFWGTVAFAPRIFLDRRERLSRVRKAYFQFLALGFVLIYFVAFSASRETRFVAVLAAVLTTFIFLNAFHAAYIRAVRQLGRLGNTVPHSPA